MVLKCSSGFGGCKLQGTSRTSQHREDAEDAVKSLPDSTVCHILRSRNAICDAESAGGLCHEPGLVPGKYFGGIADSLCGDVMARRVAAALFPAPAAELGTGAAPIRDQGRENPMQGSRANQRYLERLPKIPSGQKGARM